MDLHDRLEQILLTYRDQLWNDEGTAVPAGGQTFAEQAEADIMEAFKDAGYIKEIDVSLPAITPYEPPRAEQ